MQFYICTYIYLVCQLLLSITFTMPFSAIVFKLNVVGIAIANIIPQYIAAALTLQAIIKSTESLALYIQDLSPVSNMIKRVLINVIPTIIVIMDSCAFKIWAIYTISAHFQTIRHFIRYIHPHGQLIPSQKSYTLLYSIDL